MTKGPGQQATSSTSSSHHTPSFQVGSIQNEPIRVYPPEPGRGGYVAALQSLQNKNVAIVGLLITSSSSSSRGFAFANRVIGRCVFRDDLMQTDTTEKDVGLPATIHLYYDDMARCIYLLGVARPEYLCFCPRGSTSNAKSSSKSRLLGQRQMAVDDKNEDGPLNEIQRLRNEVDTFKHEKLKMQVLLYSSCNILFVLKENARVTIGDIKDVRALAAEKIQVLNLVPTLSKHSKRDSGYSKRDSGHLKSSSASMSGGENAFAPGRCVPLVVYVVPVPDEVLCGVIKTQGSGSSRSATVAFCKALEARLATMFRSLRSSTIGLLRMRDALSAANLSKERRLFNLDPAHSVVVVSRRTATADGRPEAQLENLLDAMESDTCGDEILINSLLQPLANDDLGLQRLGQYLRKYLELMFAFSPTGSKDSGRTELLSPSQWIKAFHMLVKSYNRMDSKRRQEAATSVAAKNGDTTTYVAPLL